MEESIDKTFINQRLDSLYEVDCKVVALLESFSSLFEAYTVTKDSQFNSEEFKNEITNKTKRVYLLLSNVAIELRKEVKIMDENIGTLNKNKEGRMILPITVEQKNTTLGDKKTNELTGVLGSVLSRCLDSRAEEKIQDNKTSSETEIKDEDQVNDIEMIA